MALTGHQKRAWRARHGKLRIDRRERSVARDGWWQRDLFAEPRVASGPIDRAINADPREVERLRRSRQQIREGEIHWGLEDDGETQSDADTA